MKHTLIVVRHFETEKNVLDIHGYSDLDNLTALGLEQLNHTTQLLKRFKFIEGVTYFKTPQAKHSAELIASKLGLPLESPLSLLPFNLGIADGISSAELSRIDKNSAKSLILFRERIIDATRLEIKGAESAESLENRLLAWWYSEGRSRTVNRIVVGSNSTVLMLSNLCDGYLPTGGQYYCHHILNGAFRLWQLIRPVGRREFFNSQDSWPDIISRRINTSAGFIQTSVHAPAWGGGDVVCLIAPGYFGNSRQGPYGLYTRLARALSRVGIEAVTLDYLGSGESSLIHRSFTSDVDSVIGVSRSIAKNRLVVLIGHSMGAAVVAKALTSLPGALGIALAPLVTRTALAQGLLDNKEITELCEEGTTIRRGIVINHEFISDSSQAWVKYRKLLRYIVLAENDQYDKAHIDTQGITSDTLNLIAHADHNFSVGDTSTIAINLVINLIEKHFQEFYPFNKICKVNSQ